MKKNVRIISISVIVLAIIALLLIPKFSSSEDNSGSPQMRGSGAIPVSVHIIEYENLANNVITSGTILANEEVELKSEVSGKITDIEFNEGSYVKKGQLLIKINDAELQAQLKRAKFRLKLLEDKEFRQRKLLEKEAISQEEYDAALNELNIAKAEVELIEAQIEKTKIIAPFSGKIGLKNVSEGSFVNTSTVIASLQNINPVKIDFSIPEKYASTVQAGDEIKFTVPGSDEKHIGRVYAIEPKIDPVTRTLKIRGVYRNPGGMVLPGSFADVELVLHEIKDAILVPTYAVVPELKGQKVYLYKSGKVVPVNIETGIRREKTVQVVSGLNENDTLITSGILQVRPGAPVSIKEFN